MIYSFIIIYVFTLLKVFGNNHNICYHFHSYVLMQLRTERPSDLHKLFPLPHTQPNNFSLFMLRVYISPPPSYFTFRSFLYSVFFHYSSLLSLFLFTIPSIILFPQIISLKFLMRSHGFIFLLETIICTILQCLVSR